MASKSHKSGCRQRRGAVTRPATACNYIYAYCTLIKISQHFDVVDGTAVALLLFSTAGQCSFALLDFTNIVHINNLLFNSKISLHLQHHFPAGGVGNGKTRNS